MERGAPQPTNPIPPDQPAGSTPNPSPTTTPTPTPTTPDYAQYIPEQYRSDPKRYFDEINEAKQWAEYGRRIAPHHKTFETVQKDWQAFDNWRKSQQAHPSSPTPDSRNRQTPEAEDEPEIDWSEPDEIGKAFRRQQQAIHSYVQDFTQEIDRMRQETKTAQDTIFEMVKIQQELRDLRDQELYSHVKFQPKTNPQDLAQYMLENQLNDAHKAYELLYGRPSLEAKVQQLEHEKAEEAKKRYEQGLADKERELAAQRVTTETATGTPWRLRTEGRSGLKPGSRERHQEIMDKAAAKAGVPREAYQ